MKVSAVLLGLALSILIASSAMAQNLIPDGGGEGGYKGYEIVSIAPRSYVGPTYDPALVISGDTSLEMDNPAPADEDWKVQFSTPNLSLIGGTYYLLSFDVKTDEPTTLTVLAHHNESPYPLRGLWDSFAVDPGITTVEKLVKSDVTDDKVRICFCMGKYKGRIWLDNFRLVPVNEISDNLTKAKISLNSKRKAKVPFWIYNQERTFMKKFTLNSAIVTEITLEPGKYYIAPTTALRPDIIPTIRQLNLSGAAGGEVSADFTKIK